MHPNRLQKSLHYTAFYQYKLRLILSHMFPRLHCNSLFNTACYDISISKVYCMPTLSKQEFGDPALIPATSCAKIIFTLQPGYH